MGVKWKWDVFDRGRNINKIRIRNNNEFLAEVKSYKGVPYLSSGTSRSGVDCSGLIYKGLINSGYNGNRLNAQSLARLGLENLGHETLRTKCQGIFVAKILAT